MARSSHEENLEQVQFSELAPNPATEVHGWPNLPGFIYQLSI
jgi:hypothetical protein